MARLLTPNTRRLAASSVIVLTAMGCGSKNGNVGNAARQMACIGQLEHVRATVALKQLISAGSVTKAQLARRFDGIPETDYLASDGTLKPFKSLTTNAQTAVIDWIGVLEAHGGPGDRLAAAEAKADVDAKQACR